MPIRRNERIRLDKLVASVTDFSRSEVKKRIRSGEITVSGKVVTDVGFIVADFEQISLDGNVLRSPLPRYFMLNKPLDYVCATRDRLHATVIDLLMEDNPQRLHIAGRLDLDATGLVLITDDGKWSHAITSPARACWKRYRVRTAEVIDPKLVEQFERGLYLAEEKQRTLPAQLELVDDFEALLRIQEGRYHQVKRMFAASGNAVTALHREAIGEIELDPDLAPGEYRALSDAEVSSVAP